MIYLFFYACARPRPHTITLNHTIPCFWIFKSICDTSFCRSYQSVTNNTNTALHPGDHTVISFINILVLWWNFFPSSFPGFCLPHSCVLKHNHVKNTQADQIQNGMCVALMYNECKLKCWYAGCHCEPRLHPISLPEIIKPSSNYNGMLPWHYETWVPCYRYTSWYLIFTVIYKSIQNLCWFECSIECL